MPVQHTVMGKSVPSYRLPRRFLIAVAVTILFIVSALVYVLDSSVPAVPSVAELSESVPHQLPHPFPKPTLPKLNVPSFPNPFRQVAHKPAVQANSTSGQVNWHSHWGWLHPFSSSITLDEDRAVLPPLKKRPIIYTFYDTSEKKDEATKTAEHKLLTIWRRAWWAQGFKPIILGRAEAMNNPLHETLRSQKLPPALEADLARWLAWEHMGTGVLANWLALPMAPHDDPVLTYLRRGTYPKLTRYSDLGSGLLCGDSSAITAVLKQALVSPAFNESKSLVEAVPKPLVNTDQSQQAIAFYDSTNIEKNYKGLSKKAGSSRAGILEPLAALMNSHLHNTFQNVFSKGVAVLKPLPDRSTSLVDPALRIARCLAQCPDSPLPSSCPPNRPKCTPCDGSHSLLISTPQILRNSSTLFTIGTVPHPYTLSSLISQRADVNTRFIRRQTKRDPWILAATRELMGPDIGGTPRLIKFKESVAGEWDSPRSLWITPEKGEVQNVDWHFGFTLPQCDISKGPSSGAKSTGPDPEGPVPTEKELQQEMSLLDKASNAVMSTSKQQKALREMVEAWNLIDTEAWKFARAYRARSHVERTKWEEEEENFAGGMSSDGRGSRWSKWFDSNR